MNLRIKQIKEEEICITEEEITQITIKKLNNMLCPQEVDSFFIEKGKLMRRMITGIIAAELLTKKLETQQSLTEP